MVNTPYVYNHGKFINYLKIYGVLYMKRLFTTLSMFIGIFCWILFTACTPAAAQDAKTVLVLPFTIHAQQDLSFLQTGIQDMLTSRLSQEGAVRVVDKSVANQAASRAAAPLNAEKALAVGRQLSADYVLFGSLTVFGESISTDARFLETAESHTLVNFHQTAENQGDLIQHVNLFAAQINEQVFGRKTDGYSLAGRQQPQSSDERYMHPEKLWQKEGIIEMSDPYGRMGPDAKAPSVRWKSRNFETAIKGLAVGDIDNDGHNETVFIDRNTMFVYRFMDGRFEKIVDFTGDPNNEFMGIDIADINQNGVAEIFVTAVVTLDDRLASQSYSAPQRIGSFVLEWDGTNFKKIVQAGTWYYRVGRLPDRSKPVLFGQKATYRQLRGDLAWGRIYELQWADNEYAPANGLSFPKQANVFGFAYGDVMNNGQTMIVAFDNKDFLTILNTGGKEEWRSMDPHGGGASRLEFPMAADTKIGTHQQMNTYYLPQRIHLTDFDGDGKNEVIVATNTDAAKVLTQTKVYKFGYVECLSWENFGLYPKWTTRKIGGYISDLIVADLDNDGQDELVYAVVPKKSVVAREEKSFLVSQEFPAKEAADSSSPQ